MTTNFFLSIRILFIYYFFIHLYSYAAPYYHPFNLYSNSAGIWNMSASIWKKMTSQQSKQRATQNAYEYKTFNWESRNCFLASFSIYLVLFHSELLHDIIFYRNYNYYKLLLFFIVLILLLLLGIIYNYYCFYGKRRHNQRWNSWGCFGGSIFDAKPPSLCYQSEYYLYTTFHTSSILCRHILTSI